MVDAKPIQAPNIHANAVAIGEFAVLIEGPSGSGKSDLSFRLIDRGATLIADDRVTLSAKNGKLWASAPATLQGQMELRSLGIVDMPFIDKAPVALVVKLDDNPPRYPLDEPKCEREGIKIPCFRLSAKEVSAPAKIELALQRVIAEIGAPPNNVDRN